MVTVAYQSADDTAFPVSFELEEDPAIAAREFPDGALVTVDGAAGTVRLEK